VAQAVFLALLLLTSVLALRNVSDRDFGIHMAGGRFVVENGRVPSTDPFTYTVSDHEYLAYHWLFQVGLFATHSLAGMPGVALVRWLILVVAFLLVADAVRGRAPHPLAAACCGLLALLASEWRFTMRPELVSYLLLAATLCLLERHRCGRRTPLFLLPLVQLVWINTHVYVFGWAVMLAYLGERWLQTRALPRRLLGSELH
jgi:hypothetical protein